MKNKTILEVNQVRIINGKPSIITHGSYMGTRGISDHWTWKEIKADGSLGREKGGYSHQMEIGKLLKHKIRIVLAWSSFWIPLY